MKPVRLLLALLLLVAGHARLLAEPAPDEALKALVERQRALLAAAATKQSRAELEDLRQPLQTLVFDYETFVGQNPSFAPGFVSFALLLGNPVIDERKRAAALLLEANRLDPDLPLVKNQLGNYLAEEGRPLEALNYYLAAVKLAPKEPLYHFQLGSLLAEAREDIVADGHMTRADLERSMLEAFRQAAALAPDRVDYAYRLGLAHYDLTEPRWDEAAAVWQALDARVETDLEHQTLALHLAKVRLAQGRPDEARKLIAAATDPVLARNRARLEADLAAVEAARPDPPAGTNP